MVDALLYYRTNATRAALVPDPTNLPDAQKLEFQFPENLLEGIERVYMNNITKTPALGNTGVRRVTADDAGVKQNPTYRIHGNFDNPQIDQALTKLFYFESLLQIEEAFHVEGIFGLSLPNSTIIEMDPDDEKGFLIERTMLKHKGPANTIFDFAVDLTWGGLYSPSAPT